MKTLKIYNILAIIIRGILVIWILSLLKNLNETEILLEQCSDRYYEEIGKKKNPNNIKLGFFSFLIFRFFF